MSEPLGSLTIPSPDDALKAIVVKAIFDSLEQRKRDDLVASALQSLLEKRGDSWHKGLTRLQEAFNDSVDQVARDIVRKHVTENAEIRTKIEEMMNAALRRFFDDKGRVDGVVNRLADGIAHAFVAER